MTHTDLRHFAPKRARAVIPFRFQHFAQQRPLALVEGIAAVMVTAGLAAPTTAVGGGTRVGDAV